MADVTHRAVRAGFWVMFLHRAVRAAPTATICDTLWSNQVSMMESRVTQYDPDKHHRRNIRLPGYDYRRDGMYFVTLCTCDRGWLFGEVHDGIMRPNDYGRIVAINGNG